MLQMTLCVLKYCNELLNRQLELMGVSETLDIISTIQEIMF